MLAITDVVKDYDAVMSSAEHLRGVFGVMSLDERQCLGCLYIEPTTLPGYDAEVFCWIRASHAADLDGRLYDTLRAWIEAQWPFRAVAYRGRAMSWETFAALKAVAEGG